MTLAFSITMLARSSDECQRLRLARARAAHERSFLGRWR